MGGLVRDKIVEPTVCPPTTRRPQRVHRVTGRRLVGRRWAVRADSDVFLQNFQSYRGKRRWSLSLDGLPSLVTCQRSKVFGRMFQVCAMAMVWGALTWDTASSVYQGIRGRNMVSRAHRQVDISGNTNSRLAVVVQHLQDSSSLSGAPWGDVLSHMNTRLQWEDSRLFIDMYDWESLQRDGLGDVDAVLVLGVQDEEIATGIASATLGFDSFIAINSSMLLQKNNRIKGRGVSAEGGMYPEWIQNLFFKSSQERVKALEVMTELYERRSSDDLLFSFLVYFNVAVRPIASVVNSTKRGDAGLRELGCMITKCGKQIFDCVNDPVCKTALDCLNSCSFNDQVCSYRCIASYESPQLADFSLCILQKHNCLGLSSEIPSKPEPRVMKEFKGQPMTSTLAKQLFTGWLGDASNSLPLPQREPFSWRVFAGKNAAYDYFPCQMQLFYPGKAKNSFWYRPIFKVKTMDDRVVWRERLYRVRELTDSKHTPAFRFSVLDNGVTSLENWYILDCHENLLWCIFAYAGAASRAGLSYSGAILASRDGKWPADNDSLSRIYNVLDQNGIKSWELSAVDNSQCDDFFNGQMPLLDLKT